MRVGVRCTALASVGALLTLASIYPRDTSSAQARRASQAESLAAWQRIATVLQHPRCLNCHQLDSPLQGDSSC